MLMNGRGSFCDQGGACGAKIGRNERARGREASPGRGVCPAWRELRNAL